MNRFTSNNSIERCKVKMEFRKNSIIVTDMEKIRQENKNIV